MILKSREAIRLNPSDRTDFHKKLEAMNAASQATYMNETLLFVMRKSFLPAADKPCSKSATPLFEDRNTPETSSILKHI